MPDLDSASMIIGELKGQFSALEKYIHKQFHDQNQQAQVQYGYLEKILKELKDLRESDHQTNSDVHESLQDRLTALEAINTRREGLKGGIDWVMRSPVIAWLITGFGVLWAAITGRLHL